MKRSLLKKCGRQGKINMEANRKLKDIFQSKGIDRCEIRLPKCLFNWTLQFVHKHKRNWYHNTPELLSSFNEVLLGCQSCHTMLENDKDLTEKTFKRLRG